MRNHPKRSHSQTTFHVCVRYYLPLILITTRAFPIAAQHRLQVPPQLPPSRRRQLRPEHLLLHADAVKLLKAQATNYKLTSFGCDVVDFGDVKAGDMDKYK